MASDERVLADSDRAAVTALLEQKTKLHAEIGRLTCAAADVQLTVRKTEDALTQLITAFSKTYLQNTTPGKWYFDFGTMTFRQHKESA